MGNKSLVFEAREIGTAIAYCMEIGQSSLAAHGSGFMRCG
jgi:hypothetical protein